MMKNDRDDAPMTAFSQVSDYLGFRSYGGVAELHCHDFHQIVLPRCGRLELEIGGKGGCVETGRGAFIAAGTRHAFRAEGDNRFVVLDTADPAFGDAALDRLAQSAFFPLQPAMQGLLDFLGAMAVQDVPENVRGHWRGLFHAALTAPAPDNRERDALARAMAFMGAHLDRRLSVRDIAREAGVSETRLHALFRAERGVSPHAALIEMRLDRALSLLATTRASIAEIALMTGHGDQSGLTRRLRQSRGLTPAAYRKAARNGHCG